MVFHIYIVIIDLKKKIEGKNQLEKKKYCDFNWSADEGEFDGCVLYDKMDAT